jgi:ubiquinone/menaquinone biosynthesis C-methylase UbiE
MKRTDKSINPHGDEFTIKKALLECKSDDGMDYDKFYNTINYVSPGIHMKKYFKYCISRIQKNGLWLDVGCGSGNIIKKAITDKNINLYGMDVVDKSVKNAISNGINCIKNSATDKYPYESDKFDLVTCTDVLEHLHPAHVNTALEEIYRVLKEGGIALLAPATKNDKTGYFHLTIESKSWWVDMMESSGFKFVEYVGQDGISLKK